MTEIPETDITIASEVRRHLLMGEASEAYDILRHEGLKHVAEKGLYLAGANELGRATLKYLVGGAPVVDPLLRTYVSTLELDGPIGLNPGWDKPGNCIQAWQALGAHHTTVGGVSLFPQTGKRMPRLFTFSNQFHDNGMDVSINSMGFPSPGARATRFNINRQRQQAGVHIPVIVQLTMNHEFFQNDNLDLVHELMRMTAEELLDVADGFSIGLTSPNIDNMRKVQTGNRADQFILRVAAAVRNVASTSNRHIPIIFKGHGDLGERQWEYYCRWAEYREDYFDAFELINTTRLPHIWAKYGINPDSLGGGLAGADPDYQQLALDATTYVYEAIGDRFDIITTGGINSGPQLVKALESGGSAGGINSAIPKLGLGAMKLIERDALALLKQKYPKATSLDQIIGIATSRGPKNMTREAPANKRANIARRIGQATQSIRPFKGDKT